MDAYQYVLQAARSFRPASFSTCALSLVSLTAYAEPTSDPKSPAEPAGGDALEAELARELGAVQQPKPGTAPRPSAPANPTGSASAYGLSNALNPAISANITLLAGGTTREDDAIGFLGDESGNLEDGFTLQEVELRLSSIVDPYFRADITFSGNLEEVGFEEAYLSTLELPRVTLRAGQLFANFGRHNILHTHAFPFLTAPLPWRALFGADGLKAPGVSVDLLLPLPFFTEVNLQAFSGDWVPFQGGADDDPDTLEDESVPDRRRTQDLNYLGHLKMLFDLDDASTLELGATYLGGRNGFGHLTSVNGADITFKWRPVEAERSVGLDWTVEYVRVKRNGSPSARELGGAYAGLRVQFLRRWWGQGRGAVLGVPRGDAGRTFREEALLAFVPTEFSLLRLQYAHEAGPGDPVHELFFQATATIGPHPAHAY